MLTETIKLRFLGVGGASQVDLGHASVGIEIGAARMLVDCGPGTVNAFRAQYGAPPDAVFITHCHLDHVGDFENLFIQSWFHRPAPVRPKIFVPASIIELLNTRVGSYPEVLAEGGVNFWDAFQLIPVTDRFIFCDQRFEVIAVRHHAPGTAFGLLLRGQFFYTGDTRPIPEVLRHSLGEKERIFHDCGVLGNPSHTGIDDLLREYSPQIIERIHCYHYYSPADVQEFRRRGLQVVRRGEVFEFPVDEG